MKGPILISAMLHVTIATCAVLFATRASSSAARQTTLAWLPDRATPLAAAESEEDLTAVVEPELPEPELVKPVPIPSEAPAPLPESAPLPVAHEVDPWRSADLLRKAGLARVRRPTAARPQRQVSEAKPTPPRPQPAKRPKQKAAQEPRAYVAPSPKAEDNKPPRYPRIARRRGLQGEVQLNVLVGTDGRAKRVVLAKSSGHAVLDDEARRAVLLWCFEPAKRRGTKVEAWFPVPVHFQLRG